MLRSWRLPSELDLRNLAATLGVGAERDLMLDPFLERYLSRWQEIDRIYLSQLEELAGPASPYAPQHPERPTPPLASALFHETRCEMRSKRLEVETEVVSAIVAIAEQHDDADRNAIAASKARFEAARSRARAVDLSIDVSAARLDLGLLLKAFGGEMCSFGIESPEGALIEAYWRELTPPSERAVNNECRYGPRMNALWMELWNLRPNAPPEIGIEFRELSKKYHQPFFERARINIEWTPRIAALLPEAKRSEFIAMARAIMFPRFLGDRPEGRGRAQRALRDALEIPSLDTDQKERILVLVEELDRRIEEVDQRLMASWIMFDRVGCNLQPQRDLPERIEFTIDRLLAERDRKEAEAIRIVELILTPSQFKQLTVEPPPLGPDETTETVPGPDGKPLERRVKRDRSSAPVGGAQGSPVPRP
ncbi:MAG: hypothetical protein KF724_13870 [Phycisphaeraceae bacterium]|nr:hypothetical protein [Phycisphaeraceae bacterium]